MKQRLLQVLQFPFIVGLLVVAVTTPGIAGYNQQFGLAHAQGSCRLFAETGKNVCDKFLTYWDEHGGLRQQGFPISSEFEEISAVDGKAYTVQYFERAQFEKHPENQPPYDVLLSLLGRAAMDEKYPDGPPRSESDQPEVGQYFPETGQWVSAEFLDYWNANGGLAQQGYPISSRFMETSALDGNEYVVQYFERAVFELHPEMDEANRVLLTQLGTEQFRSKYPNGDPPPGSLNPMQLGRWGGAGVTMDVRSDGAFLEFNCAHAMIDTPLFTRGEAFDMSGLFVLETGGPVLVDDNVAARPARFTGSVTGNTLTLTITYTDDNTKIGTYTLAFGNEGRLMKCM